MELTGISQSLVDALNNDRMPSKTIFEVSCTAARRIVPPISRDAIILSTLFPVSVRLSKRVLGHAVSGS